MATAAITPPPGFELEKPQGIKPPPGFELEGGSVSEKDLPGSTPLLRAAASKLPSRLSTPTEFERARDPKNFKSSASIIGGDIGLPGAPSPYPGMDLDAKTEQASESRERDLGRKQMGRSLGYRAIAPIGEALGVNASGMEQEADVGNAGGVMAHAAVPAATAIAPLAMEGAVRSAPQIGRTAAAIGKPALKMGLEAASDVPIVRGLVKGAKAFKDVPSEVGKIWEKEPAPRNTPLGKRESLADRAGIQAGRPEPNIDISNPPEPSNARNVPSKKPLGPPNAEEFRAPIGTPKTPLWKQLGIEPTKTSDMTGGIQETPAPEPKFLRQQANVEPPNQKPLGNPDMEADGPAARIGRLSDNQEDAGIRQAMDEDLTNHGRSAYAEERQRKLGELQEMGIGRPKWQRTAESQAQQILDEAQQKAQAIVESSRQKNTRGIFSKVPQEAKPLPDDLTGLLQKSIEQARARKK